MSYFVTGATGFIGRFLVEQLLANREGDVHVLVREGSRGKLDELMAKWPHNDRVKPVVGDLQQPRLGVDQGWIDEHKGQITGFFHLAAIYDMTADDERNEALNVGGTRNAVDLSNALESGCLHHVSSVAAAGSYRGLFREDMFDEGQKLPSAYHRTKFESERIARDKATTPWRVFRPAVVIGHSETGEMDKVDGPYYFFKAIQKARATLPQWVPLAGPELGWTNLVPVDFVAKAMDHIAHQPDMDGRAFHLADPRGIRSGEALNHFARAAHAPQLALRIDKRLTDALPKGVLSMAMQLPALKGVRRAVLADFGIPEQVIGHVGFTCQFDTRDTERALDGSGITVPPLDGYAERLWDFWERNLDPDLFKDRSLAGAMKGRTVVITGGTSGIGRAAAIKVAKAGGIPIVVARGQEKLDETKAEIEAMGHECHAYSCDLASTEAIAGLCETLLRDHEQIHFVVNNAGRSIRRSLVLSLDRFHDFERTMQLNYFGTIKLVMGLLPHMREKKFGHIVNVSSIGVQTGPPRFSAYVASKSALDAWTRIVSSELIADGITFTTIHMPLVKTPMIAPTKIYDAFPTITPEEAGDMVCEAIRARPKSINTRLGTFGEVAYALMPKAVDQLMNAAYKVFPDSARAKGQTDDNERANMEQLAMANLMKGVHW